MIKLKHVKKYFNKRRSNEIRAIDDTTITLPNSGLVTFLGNSGCGKTTLLNAIGGLDNVDSGDIYIDDKRITRRTSGARDELRNAEIGYIFQNYNLIEDATVYANVALALRMTGFTGKDAIEERVMYILDRVGIARYRNRPVNMLSGGERQRVGIARAIVKNPRIIIADEPTGNLDSSNTIEIMNIIKAISREKLVILVTHERKIAEFYADRIIEIVDGKIVDDRENDHAGSLDYRMDNRIYLKDMPYSAELVAKDSDPTEGSIQIENQQTTSTGGQPPIELYTDAPEELPPIKVIIRNGHIYVDTGDRLTLGQENVEILDEHYKGLSRDVMEKYQFDYEDVYRGNNPKYNDPSKQNGVPARAKYRTIYGPWTSLKSGFKKISSYSRLKKILLLGFVLASMFVIYAISNVVGVNSITDREFIQRDKSYLAANVGMLTPRAYERYANDPAVDYVIPGGSVVAFAIPMDDYIQASWQSATIYSSVTDKERLSEDDIILGRMPTNENEAVIDILTLERMLFEEYIPKEIGANTMEAVIGRPLKHSPYVPDFTIVGISDTMQPCIFVDRKYLGDLGLYDMGMNVGAMMSEPLSTAEDEIAPYKALEIEEKKLKAAGRPIEKYLVAGELPVNDYEVMLPDYMMGMYGVGDTLEQRINGSNLVVSGFYHDMRGGQGYYANDNTCLWARMSNFGELTIAPVIEGDIESSKASALATLEDGTAEVVDSFAQTESAYRAEISQNILRVEIMAAIIIVISLIEIYLILRASFLSRIKEVGVLRAVGLKKSDIYRMFSGEVVAITLITAIPGMAAMAYILHTVSSVVSTYKMNIWIVLSAFLIVLVFNLIGGLLPVFNTLRKTPAEILARNDAV